MTQEHSPCCGFLGMPLQTTAQLGQQELCSRPDPLLLYHPAGSELHPFSPCAALLGEAEIRFSLAVLTLVPQESNS